MHTLITEAYQKIFDKDPENMVNWQIAKFVIENFNVPKLGAELARKVLTEIISDTDFPNGEVTREVIGRAENLLTEFTGEFGDEPHFAAIEATENQKKYRK